jgi:WD40 repeat protein
MITLSNVGNEQFKDQAGEVEAPIQELGFNEKGTRMVSVTESGHISIWKELNCLITYAKERRITAVCNADLTIEKKNKPAKLMSLFFVGNTQGFVWYVNETSCQELCKLSSGVLFIAFYKEGNCLMLVTDNYDLRLFKLNGNMTAPDKKVRLPVSSDAKSVKLCWMDPCSFGISSWDGLVRLWNLKNDSNYTLNLSDINRDNQGMAFIMGTRSSPQTRSSPATSAPATKRSTAGRPTAKSSPGKTVSRAPSHRRTTTGAT